MRQASATVLPWRLYSAGDAATDPAAVAQIDLVVSATDPQPDRLTPGPPSITVVEDDGYRVVASPSAMRYPHGADHLPYRDQEQRPGRPPASADSREPSGEPTPPGARPRQRRPATVCAGRWPIRPHPATCSHAADAPEKRKVGGSRPKRAIPSLRGCECRDAPHEPPGSVGGGRPRDDPPATQSENPGGAGGTQAIRG